MDRGLGCSELFACDRHRIVPAFLRVADLGPPLPPSPPFSWAGHVRLCLLNSQSACTYLHIVLASEINEGRANLDWTIVIRYAARLVRHVGLQPINMDRQNVVQNMCLSVVMRGYKRATTMYMRKFRNQSTLLKKKTFSYSTYTVCMEVRADQQMREWPS